MGISSCMPTCGSCRCTALANSRLPLLPLLLLPPSCLEAGREEGLPGRRSDGEGKDALSSDVRAEREQMRVQAKAAARFSTRHSICLHHR